MIWWFIAFGFLGGIFGGMGMGGGTLLIPLLTIFLNVEQRTAQGLNLMSFLIMAVVALIIHERNGLVEKKGIIPIIISGLLFSAVGAFTAGFIPNEVLRILFGVFLSLLAIYEFYKVFKEKNTKAK